MRIGVIPIVDLTVVRSAYSITSKESTHRAPVLAIYFTSAFTTG
jgi:hypothetical protein